MPYKMDLAYADVPEEHGRVVEQLRVDVPHEQALYFRPAQRGRGTDLDRDVRDHGGRAARRGPHCQCVGFADLAAPAGQGLSGTGGVFGPPGHCADSVALPDVGRTSPFSLAGTVVTYNAENLAAIVTIQTLQPGAAVVYHNVASAFNMRSARSSLGGPEKILFGLAGADMGRFYDLPCGTAGSSTDSPRFDGQNGAESMAQLLLAVSGRANMVTGIGSLGGGNGTSAEQILFDCDLIALADYLAKGFAVDEERLALCGVGAGRAGGQFSDRRAYHDAAARRRALPRRRLRSQRHV